MDSSYILKTAHKLCASYAEAFACRSGGVLSQVEIPKGGLGLFTPQQVRYIEDASRDINTLKSSIVKTDVQKLGHEEDSEIIIKKYQSKLALEETQALLKFVWSYMVFTMHPSTDKEYKDENKLLWEKLVKQLTLHVITIKLF